MLPRVLPLVLNQEAGCASVRAVEIGWIEDWTRTWAKRTKLAPRIAWQACRHVYAETSDSVCACDSNVNCCRMNAIVRGFCMRCFLSGSVAKRLKTGVFVPWKRRKGQSAVRSNTGR